MKATICLLADLETENFCREFMVEASMKNGVGVAAANLPRHISLGFPYEINDWNLYVSAVDQYSTGLRPVEVTLTGMKALPVAGITGSFFFLFDEDFGLDELRLRTVRSLNENLGLGIPEVDNVTGKKTITLGFGTAPFSDYNDYVLSVDPRRYEGKVLRFNELGIFYYDSDKMTATSFMCAKRYKLEENS